MNFKLDENLPLEISNILKEGGHSALTVLDEGLGGNPDTKIMKACVDENRVLVTLDLDFSDIRVYPPDRYPGIIVLRPTHQSKPNLINLSPQFLSVLEKERLKGHLWIVEPGRVRIRSSKDI